MATPIDWSVAALTAARLTPAGPSASRDEAERLVSELREAARVAAEHVGHVTTLGLAADLAAARPVYVIDRPRFAQANAAMLASMSAGVLDDHTSRTSARLAGRQIGLGLAALSTRVLGQFDPFTHPDGRLLLVAPNVLRFERELDADPADFRLWVCLHEQTHAVQFAAAPWLPHYLRARIATLLAALLSSPERQFSALARAARKLPEVLADEADDAPAGALPIADLLEPSARDALGEIVAAMSLLEGHADVVMDAVGPKVVASIDAIRPKFDARRVSRGRLERTVRRLLGMDAKMAQYRDGARFVRAVLGAVGHEGLALAFADPTNLPSPSEIATPGLWVARVHPASTAR